MILNESLGSDSQNVIVNLLMEAVKKTNRQVSRSELQTKHLTSNINMRSQVQHLETVQKYL